MMSSISDKCMRLSLEPLRSSLRSPPIVSVKNPHSCHVQIRYQQSGEGPSCPAAGLKVYQQISNGHRTLIWSSHHPHGNRRSSQHYGWMETRWLPLHIQVTVHINQKHLGHLLLEGEHACSQATVSVHGASLTGCNFLHTAGKLSRANIACLA